MISEPKKTERNSTQLVLLLTSKTIHTLPPPPFTQTVPLVQSKWDADRKCSAQNSLLLKPGALKEGSPRVRIATARVEDAVVGCKVEFFESLRQPTAPSFASTQSNI